MTDQEFDILDELYFVKTYAELEKDLPNLIITLSQELENLIQIGWVRVLDRYDNEIFMRGEELKANLEKYKYIATKQGLKAHNQV